jgi:glycosyltransferase involved in cell wall biosynthesis
MDFLFWGGVIILAVTAFFGLDLMRGSRSIRFLRQIPSDLPIAPPRVSVIAAARNEARHLRQALGSLLALDYPNLELILVNDRSDDATGEILAEMAAADRRLKIIHITDLPPGWLGKNHALWNGSLQASGELLLFTDADIVMSPATLTLAVSFLRREGLDHLTVSPEMRMPGIFLNMFGASFLIFFSFVVRPWKARDPRSPAHIGIGAFNLVRADTYRRTGGHQTIRLRPDDDLKLGKIIKNGGFRQDMAYGAGLLSVEWYNSVGELIKGLEKNAFSGTDYRVAVTLGGVVTLLTGSVWPYIALFVTIGPAWWIYAATVVLITLVFVDNCAFQNTKPWYAAGYPLTAALFAYILLRTMILNLTRGGIVWRSTFYPLEELRKNKV